MKRLQHPALGILILLATQTVYASSPETDFVSRRIKEMTFAEQQQQMVWPGFHPASKPAIIQFQSFIDEKKPQVTYALNFTPGSLAWQKLEVSGKSVYFLPEGRELNLASSMTGKFNMVDGQNSFIDIEYDNFTANENITNSFMSNRAKYYFQHESSIDASHLNYANIIYDSFNNPEFIKLLFLEDAALTLSQQNDTGRAEESLRDAVAIRQYRNQLAGKPAVAYENGNDIMTGIPVYISWTSQQLNDEDYRKMSQRTGCAPLSGTYDNSMVIECLQSGMPAFASSVYGRALDKKSGQAWKQNVESQFKSIPQTAVDYYHFSDEQAKTIAQQAIKKTEYQYDRIERIINHIMQSYLTAMSTAKDKYQKLGGIELRTSYELGSAMILISMFPGSDVYSEKFTLNNQEYLFEDLNIVAGETGDSNILSLKDLPYMLVHTETKDFDIDPKRSYTALKLDDNAQLNIDGKTLSASEFVRARKVQSFTKLIITDSHVTLPVDPGTLDASDGILKLASSSNDASLAKKSFMHGLLKQAVKKYKHAENK